jgi:hypothetical protein
LDWVWFINQLIGLLIGGMIFALFIIGFILIQRQRNLKMVDGKILCHFFGNAGYYAVLCKHEGNKVEPPEGHHIKGSYLIKNECIYPGNYPPGWPRLMQVGVSCTAYKENEDEPIISKAPNVWLGNEKRSVITASMRQSVLNESQMKIMAAMGTTVWKDIATMAQFIKNVPLQFKIIIGLCGIALIQCYVLYMIWMSVVAIRG